MSVYFFFTQHGMSQCVSSLPPSAGNFFSDTGTGTGTLFFFVPVPVPVPAPDNFSLPVPVPYFVYLPVPVPVFLIIFLPGTGTSTYTITVTTVLPNSDPVKKSLLHELTMFSHSSPNLNDKFCFV